MVNLVIGKIKLLDIIGKIKCIYCTYLLKKLFSDWKKGLEAKNKDGNSHLHIAAERGDIEVLSALIENGADIEAKNNFKQTPVFFAALNNHIEAVEFLVEK